MFFAVKPEKSRSETDKQEIAKKYKAGESVLPHINTRERTKEEEEAEEEDRRLMQEVREMSLREAETGIPGTIATGRSRSSDNRSVSSRNRSADDRSGQRGDMQSRSPGQTASRQNSDHLQVGDRGHRRQRSDSRHRQVEHQSSIRSLIGSAELSERDIEREIEEFARQIQEEGLLDGLDLDNIDLTRDDDLSKRITDAYRRRQRERRTNAPSRSPAAHGRQRDNSQSETTDRPNNATETAQSQTPTSHGDANDGSSPSPDSPSPSATRDVPNIPTRSGRRRTHSGGPNTLAPFPGVTPPLPAGRSQTDLAIRTRPLESAEQVPGLFSERSASVPSSPPGNPPPTNNISFANRLAQSNPTAASETSSQSTARPHRASDLEVVQPGSTHLTRDRSPSQLYPEPTITCYACNKEQIQYDLHYNCHICANGQLNLCLDCYRRGKGCQFWFGFGQGASRKWEKLRQQRNDDSLPPPHVLVPRRYLRPASQSGEANAKPSATTDDPNNRLETGTFCAKCLAWTNDCYWRCDICNDGEWGFCNNCVNQGNSCSHMLLPLIYEASDRYRRSVGRPPQAAVAANLGQRTSAFKPLLFNSTCDICHNGIVSSDVRFHCHSCTSSLVEDASPGDYDICSPCYASLVARGQISHENGYSGWRRCLQGHRMVVIGFVDSDDGRWRFIDRDLVGGRSLRMESIESSADRFQKWTWKHNSDRLERLVTQDVSETAPHIVGSKAYATDFPPEGGPGSVGRTKWAWYPQGGTDDELLFPKGAEVKEIEDVNGDWFFGTYMGAKGLFPAPYVHVEISWI